MTALAFAIPPSGMRLDPTPRLNRSPQKGDVVKWLKDADIGVVMRVIPQESCAILWDSTGVVVWYRLLSIEDQIELIDSEDGRLL